MNKQTKVEEGGAQPVGYKYFLSPSNGQFVNHVQSSCLTGWDEVLGCKSVVDMMVMMMAKVAIKGDILYLSLPPSLSFFTFRGPDCYSQMNYKEEFFNLSFSNSPTSFQYGS